MPEKIITKAQRQILVLAQTRTIRRYSRRKYTRKTTTTTLYWAADLDGSPGPELTERVVHTLLDKGWIETQAPDRKPQSLNDFVQWQMEATLRLTDAGKAVLEGR